MLSDPDSDTLAQVTVSPELSLIMLVGPVQVAFQV